MAIDVLLGLQWGDEGKGKIVDVLTPHYQVIARFQGGPNAGHSLEFNGSKHVLHTIPSGIFHQGTINIVGNGVVIDPVIFKKETDALVAKGVDIYKNLQISKSASDPANTQVARCCFRSCKRYIQNWFNIERDWPNLHGQNR
jgi:adenylosuccinate synthase